MTKYGLYKWVDSKLVLLDVAGHQAAFKAAFAVPGRDRTLFVRTLDEGTTAKRVGVTGSLDEQAWIIADVLALAREAHLVFHTKSAHILGWFNQGWQMHCEAAQGLYTAIGEAEEQGKTVSFVQF